MNKTKHIAAIAVGMIIALVFYGALAACAVQQWALLRLTTAKQREAVR